MQKIILLIITAIPGLALAATVPAIPEPTTMALLAAGAAAAGLYKHVTKKNK